MWSQREDSFIVDGSTTRTHTFTEELAVDNSANPRKVAIKVATNFVDTKVIVTLH